jgi:microcin C transport system permease protein
MALSPLNQRRWRNFKQNRRAYWSLILFCALFGLSLFAELLANDKPLLVSYRGEWRMPFARFYSEADFGGDFRTEANYKAVEVECLIVTGGLTDCFDEPEALIQSTSLGKMEGTEGFQKGWILWAPIPYSYNTINNLNGKAAPSAPDGEHWLGTDDTARDVLARVIYGFRLSVAFALIVTAATSVIGIAAGAVQGYFGGKVDLIFQRFLEIWSGMPELYVIIIVFSAWQRSFWVLVLLMVVFGWTRLIGVVRAEFLRARNFE